MAKMSENSIKVINFLKENHGKKMTSQEVAEALEMSTATVNGVFTALSNKELGYREEATVKGPVDISFLAITEEGKTADVSEISENGLIVKLDGEDFEITSDMVLISLKQKEGYTSSSNSRTCIVLDKELTKELVLEGLARELVRKVQS